ncbi:MAG: Y-family DNA polymerase [bacterium]
MLWIALYLPDLPLEVVNRVQAGEASTALVVDLPLAVSDGPDNRPFVLSANPRARAAGVHPGMAVAAACALATGLATMRRDESRELQAVRQVAGWAAQFTPSVVLERSGVLLEVAASLKLFGGLARLLGQLRTGLASLGFRASFGVAPTPLGAWLLARGGHEQAGVRACLEAADLPARLGELPLLLFDWPRERLDALAVLGIHCIREALALPRDGFRRRFGADAQADFDRALGRAADPRPCFALPDRFSSRIDLPFDVIDTALLDIPLARILAELEGFLRARGAGALELVLELEHGRSVPTRLVLGSAAPERALARWQRLLRERLGRLELKSTVSAVAIHVDTLHGFGEHSTSFLPDATRRAQSWHELTERLSSRLEPGALFSVALRDDHRPEQAWRRADGRALRLRSGTGAAGRAGAASAAVAPGRGTPGQAAADATGTAVPPRPAMQSARPRRERPVFLLERPRMLLCAESRPQDQGPLELVSGPERIESGWWDGRPVARDYYVARNRAGEACWIYREPVDPSRWYLHGLFA